MVSSCLRRGDSWCLHVQELWKKEGPVVDARKAAKKAADRAHKQEVRQAGKPAAKSSATQPISKAAAHVALQVTPEQGGAAAASTAALCSDHACSNGGCDRHDRTAKPYVSMQHGTGDSAAGQGLVTSGSQCSKESRQVVPAQARPQEEVPGPATQPG